MRQAKGEVSRSENGLAASAQVAKTDTEEEEEVTRKIAALSFDYPCTIIYIS